MLSKSKLFLLICFPAAIVLLVGLAIVQENNAKISRDQFQELLKNQWFMVSLIYKHPSHADLFQNISKTTDLRITIVSRVGKVIYDSEVEGELDDHTNREEIRNAFEGYPTLATRISRSTGKPTFYYAQQLNPDLILRVAYPAEYYENQKSQLIKSIVSGMSVLIMLLIIFAIIISTNTGKTLRELGEAVEVAKNGGDDFRSFNNPTLDSALYSLSTTSRRLSELNRERSVLNKRLEYILENIEEGAILFEGDKVLYKNASSDRILGFEIPLSLRDLNNPEEITVAESLIAKDQPKELKIGDKIVSISRAESSQNMLVILHDVTDFEKYNLYKSVLVGNISHELKTPLSIILTAAETVISDQDMPAEIKSKFLNTIYRNSRRVNILIDDLIKLHTLENSDESEITETNLDDIVEDIIDVVDPGNKNIKYQCDHGVVNIHSAHILSIVTNLISNAVKYSKADKIEVNFKHDDQLLVIQVLDSGPQIPVSERERIFERFYSLSKSRNRNSAGFGLGLSIVKHIAKLYKGDARVLPNNFGGNTFEIRLFQRKGISAI
jgi:two-component system phosphate regulon sensor histidine kinase PhoR